MLSDFNSISQELITFIKENLVGPHIEVSADTTLESLGLDSFSIIELVLFIERKFGVELSDNALTKENVHSVTTLATCVVQHLSQK